VLASAGVRAQGVRGVQRALLCSAVSTLSRSGPHGAGLRIGSWAFCPGMISSWLAVRSPAPPRGKHAARSIFGGARHRTAQHPGRRLPAGEDAAPGEPRRGGAGPAPALPAGWSREPEISARTARSPPNAAGTASPGGQQPSRKL
jgi:hypothetical protein